MGSSFQRKGKRFETRKKTHARGAKRLCMQITGVRRSGKLQFPAGTGLDDDGTEKLD
jgi:hypothetical protein